MRSDAQADDRREQLLDISMHTSVSSGTNAISPTSSYSSDMPLFEALVFMNIGPCLAELRPRISAKSFVWMPTGSSKCIQMSLVLHEQRGSVLFCQDLCTQHLRGKVASSTAEWKYSPASHGLKCRLTRQIMLNA